VEGTVEGAAEKKIVAVAESILFLIYVNLQILQEQYAPLKRIIVTGGLSNSDGLCQKLANLVRLPVYRPKQCEATAMGVAYLAADLPNNWINSQAGVTFDAQAEPALHERFILWKDAMQDALRQRSENRNT